ncbi:hypothetical protein DHEL01_v209217 [Diaporthe helianthi]|uniref:Uncharacterized protein n=1 Tax=Diaporthe helianthi TaxID=158607 RepID=A0A2P5HQ93_DIAHE|nr:hypothetical protein DHEL01_v209217 [Diaporthe helianthi]
MPCRTIPRHASSQHRPATSGQRPTGQQPTQLLKSSHNEIPRTGAHHLGVPTTLLPTWLPGHPLESTVPLVKHQPREPSLPTIIYLISAGGTGMLPPAAAARHSQPAMLQHADADAYASAFLTWTVYTECGLVGDLDLDIPT